MRSKYVFLFSGQGALMQGIDKEVINCETVKSALEQLEELMKEKILHYLLRGVPNDSYVVHFVHFAYSYSVFNALLNKGMIPEVMMGHSLGQVVAILLSSVSLEQSVAFIKKRGELFKENSGRVKADMVALIGNNVEDLVSELGNEEGIYVANFNSPSQVVVSVTLQKIPFVTQWAKDKGLKYVILNIGNGCHSPLVKDIDPVLRSFIENMDFKDASIPVYSFERGFLVSKDTIKEELKEHLLSKVYWYKNLEGIVNSLGEDITFVDMGPGKVITGLVLNWRKDVNVTNIRHLLLR